MTGAISGSLNSSMRKIFKTNAFYIPNSAKKTSAAEIADEGFNSGGDTMVNVEEKSKKRRFSFKNSFRRNKSQSNELAHRKNDNKKALLVNVAKNEEVEKFSNLALIALEDEVPGQHDSSQLNDDMNTSQLFNDSTEYNNSVFDEPTSSENDLEKQIHDSRNDEVAQNAFDGDSTQNALNSDTIQDVSERFDDINDENDTLAVVVNANRSFCVSKKSKAKLSARLSSSFSKFTSFISEKRRKKGKEMEVKKPISGNEAFINEVMTKGRTKNDYSHQINQSCVSSLGNYVGEQSNLDGSYQRFSSSLPNGFNFKYTGQLQTGLSPILESPARVSRVFFDNTSENVNSEGRFNENKSFEHEKSNYEKEDSCYRKSSISAISDSSDDTDFNY